MPDTQAQQLDRALATLPCGLFLMTSAFDGKRAGHVVKSVQLCAHEPRLICVAARKGHAIAPLVRDSHAFAICVLCEADRSILRRFEQEWAPDELGDAFDPLPIQTIKTGSPVIKKSIAAIDCEVVRHFDLEADHELYIGMPIAARVFAK
jgi:flavin reductase (DIM6/NTAB) family NADH-FMN oxidoreductase RutF